MFESFGRCRQPILEIVCVCAICPFDGVSDERVHNPFGHPDKSAWPVQYAVPGTVRLNPLNIELVL